MDCNPPGSSVHGIVQPRILEGVAISSSRASSQLTIQPESPMFPALAGGFFTTEPPESPWACTHAWKMPRFWMTDLKGYRTLEWSPWIRISALISDGRLDRNINFWKRRKWVKGLNWGCDGIKWRVFQYQMKSLYPFYHLGDDLVMHFSGDILPEHQSVGVLT